MNKWHYDSDSEVYYLAMSNNRISYPESGNNDSFELENQSTWFLQRNDLINFFIQKINPQGDFLDIGSGNGFQSQSIMNSNYQGKVICCEPGISGCLNSKKRSLKFVYNGFFQDFPFEHYKIKAVGLFDVIEHIEDDISFLNDLYDKLSYDTYVFINVPGLKHLYSETDIFAGHYRRYNSSDIDRIISKTQFKLKEKTYYFNIYYIPMLIIRAIPYLLGLKKGNEEIRIRENAYLKSKNNLLNRLSDFFHKRNLMRLKKGKKIRFGTSLFFVLKK